MKKVKASHEHITKVRREAAEACLKSRRAARARMKEKVLAACQQLTRQGIYPSAAALGKALRSSGSSGGNVSELRKELVQAGLFKLPPKPKKTGTQNKGEWGATPQELARIHKRMEAIRAEKEADPAMVAKRAAEGWTAPLVASPGFSVPRTRSYSAH